MRSKRMLGKAHTRMKIRTAEGRLPQTLMQSRSSFTTVRSSSIRSFWRCEETSSSSWLQEESWVVSAHPVNIDTSFSPPKSCLTPSKKKTSCSWNDSQSTRRAWHMEEPQQHRHLTKTAMLKWWQQQKETMKLTIFSWTIDDDALFYSIFSFISH